MSKIKLAVSSPKAAQGLAFKYSNELKEGTRVGHQGIVLTRLCSSLQPIRTVLEGKSKRCSEHYDDELSSDDSTVQNINEAMANQIKILCYENQVMKA